MNYNFIRELLYECIIYDINEYLIIGSIFKSISKNNDIYKSLWIEWCIFNNNHIYEEIEKKWISFDINKNNLLDFIIIAKNHNKNKYKEIKNKNSINLINDCIIKGGTEYDVATFINLYTYDKYKGLAKKDEISLNIKLSEKYSKKFIYFIKFNMKQIGDDLNDNTENYTIILNKCLIASKIALNLKNHNYKSKVIKEIKQI